MTKPNAIPVLLGLHTERVVPENSRKKGGTEEKVENGQKEPQWKGTFPTQGM